MCVLKLCTHSLNVHVCVLVFVNESGSSSERKETSHDVNGEVLLWTAGPRTDSDELQPHSLKGFSKTIPISLKNHVFILQQFF